MVRFIVLEYPIKNQDEKEWIACSETGSKLMVWREDMKVFIKVHPDTLRMNAMVTLGNNGFRDAIFDPLIDLDIDFECPLPKEKRNPQKRKPKKRQDIWSLTSQKPLKPETKIVFSYQLEDKEE